MLRVLAAFALPSCLMACAVSGSSHRAPYSCTVGEKPRLWPAIRPSNAVPGRFEIKVLDPVTPSGNQRERRVQITADAIPIGTFAARLADALGIAISVSHEVSDVRVSITAASMSVESLLDSLQASHVHAVGKETLMFVTEQEHEERRMRVVGESLVVRARGQAVGRFRSAVEALDNPSGERLESPRGVLPAQ